jgi:hypothetical protein
LGKIIRKYLPDADTSALYARSDIEGEKVTLYIGPVYSAEIEELENFAESLRRNLKNWNKFSGVDLEVTFWVDLEDEVGSIQGEITPQGFSQRFEASDFITKTSSSHCLPNHELRIFLYLLS